MYKLVQEIFGGEVVFHYRPHWLNGLELDVFVPSKRLAFEYMGIQHYKPVEIFGGKTAFMKVQERDKRKADLCTKKGIRLIYIDGDYLLSKEDILYLINENSKDSQQAKELST